MRKRINANREVDEQLRIKLAQERLFTRQLSKVLDTIGRVANAEYKKHGTVKNAAATIDKRIDKLLKKHYRRTIITFAGRSEAGETKRQSRFQHIADDYVARAGGDKIKQISDATRARINRVIAKGVENGDGEAVIARAIESATGGLIGRKRAAIIARTEVNAAANFANAAIDRENRGELVTGRVKRWVSTNDARTRSHHRRMNGEQVPVDDSFQVHYKGNTYSMQHPGDSNGGAGNVINCRCTVIYIDEETDVVHNGKRSRGPIPVNLTRAPRGASDLEVDLTLKSFRPDLPAPFVSMLENSTPVAAIEFHGKRGGVFWPLLGKISMPHLPHSSLGAKFLEVMRVYMHERIHALDFIRNALGEFTTHSVANTTAMLRDFKKFYSVTAIDNRRKAALIEARDELAGSLSPTGVLIPASKIADDLKGTGITVKDLLIMMPDIKKVDRVRRRYLLRNASINIKHRNWDSLDTALSSYSQNDFAWFSASDYMMAITRTRVGQGHSKAYFGKGRVVNKTGYKRRHASEAFAEFGTLVGGRNHKSWTRLIKHFAPESTAGFVKLVKVLGKGKRTTPVTAAELGE